MTIFSLLQKSPTPVTILAGPFRGARMVLNPANSKRKILGVYEHILNDWLEKTLGRVQVVWDVGANDGYFTYGCAAAITRHGKKCHIVAFEPGIKDIPELSEPMKWPQYADVSIDFIPKFVGAEENDTMTTLARAAADRPQLVNLPGLVKVDVEGAEVEVLKAVGPLLAEPHAWVVEIHGDHLIEPVSEVFRRAGRRFDIIDPRPHWLFGPEQRTLKTSWLTTT
jgi:hypothetical protein